MLFAPYGRDLKPLGFDGDGALGSPFVAGPTRSPKHDRIRGPDKGRIGRTMVDVVPMGARAVPAADVDCVRGCGTHNHFALDRGGKVFNRWAPVIKLPEGASEDDHLRLLGVLNSSTACFWLKQVSHEQGKRAVSAGIEC